MLHFELHYQILATEQEVSSASRWAKYWWSVLIWRRLGCGLCKFLPALSSQFPVHISALLSSDGTALTFQITIFSQPNLPILGSLLSKPFIFNPAPPHSSWVSHLLELNLQLSEIFLFPLILGYQFRQINFASDVATPSSWHYLLNIQREDIKVCQEHEYAE